MFQNLGIMKSTWDLPALVRRSKRTSFEYIKERVWKKLQAWEEKLLLEAEREILRKAIVQAIHTYTISCFKLPLGLCIDLESLVRKFWWRQRGDRRKISLGEMVGDVQTII